DLLHHRRALQLQAAVGGGDRKTCRGLFHQPVRLHNLGRTVDFLALLRWRQAAAGELNRKGRCVMKDSELEKELKRAGAEPLLPIEKKLIGWSLGLGIFLLIVLTIINRLFPIT